MIVHEALQGLGPLDRVQILAEEVLHQRDFGVVLTVDENGGDGDEAGPARRGTAPLSRRAANQARPPAPPPPYPPP